MVPVILLALLVISLSRGGPVQAQNVQKITITMREFTFTPARVTLQAGVPAEITLINRGKVAHEFMVYAVPRRMGSASMGHEWVEKNNYFQGLPATVEGGKVTRKGGHLLEIVVGPGQTATLKFTPTRKGTFEFGCMITGHYEAGQKGMLIVK
jgi:uncharacterized cupredoxin-like copper-binding protein